MNGNRQQLEETGNVTVVDLIEWLDLEYFVFRFVIGMINTNKNCSELTSL